jgi:protein-S-isoprenylcysteine O-methyltransferase Ste14
VVRGPTLFAGFLFCLGLLLIRLLWSVLIFAGSLGVGCWSPHCLESFHCSSEENLRFESLQGWQSTGC